MNFENVQRFFKTPAGREVLAQVNEAETVDREELLDQFAALRKEAGEIGKANSKRQSVAQAKVDAAKKTLVDAQEANRLVAIECRAAAGVVDRKLTALENQLKQVLPENIAESLECLDAELERLRELPDQNGRERERFKSLFSLRQELAGAELFALPAAQLESVVNRVYSVLDGVSELAVV